jgi:glycosyltransferase 2 family protein
VQGFLHDTQRFFDHLAAVDFRALAIAVAFQILRVVVRTRAWRNIIAAAYPETPVRWRYVLGAYLGGVGLNAVTPARSGDVLKLFLVKHRVEGSTYPTLASTLVVETMFDAVVGIALLVWAVSLGVLPSFDTLPDLPNIDFRWVFEHPVALMIGALLLGIGIGVGLVWATARVRAFWHRVAQGFAILREPTEYLRRVATWQALSWCCRFATLYWMLRAFHVPASLHNALLAQIAQSLSTLLPITPGGAGTEQGLLLYLFSGQAPRSALLSFSVGAHIAIVVVNVALGVVAVGLLTRSLRFGRLREAASSDSAEVPEEPTDTERYGTQSEPR